MSTNQIQPIIKLENVELSFDKDRGNVLDGISLSINPGEHVCILGANGSGKSPLAQVIAGMMAPDSGSVYLCNKLVYSNETKAIPESYRQARQYIGYVFQDPQDNKESRPDKSPRVVCSNAQLNILYDLKLNLFI